MHSHVASSYLRGIRRHVFPPRPKKKNKHTKEEEEEGEKTCKIIQLTATEQTLQILQFLHFFIIEIVLFLVMQYNIDNISHRMASWINIQVIQEPMWKGRDSILSCYMVIGNGYGCNLVVLSLVHIVYVSLIPLIELVCTCLLSCQCPPCSLP